MIESGRVQQQRRTMRAIMVSKEGRVTAKNLFVISDVPPSFREDPPYRAFLRRGRCFLIQISHLYSMFLSNLLVINLMARMISGLMGFFVQTGHS